MPEPSSTAPDNGGDQSPYTPDAVMATIYRAASAASSRLRFSQDTGLSFGGLRDYDVSLGYDPKPTIASYRQRYNRWGIAKRIVEAYPQATWSEQARISEDPDPKVTTPFEKAVDDLFTKHQLWSRLLRADILAGLGRYAVLLIGAPGELDTELPPSLTAEQILYFQPMAEDRVDAITFVSDTGDKRFGLPESYQLTIGTVETVISPIAVQRTTATIKTVHWTRVLHIADGLLDDDVFGTPRLEAVNNYLDDLMKVVGGGAEAAWKRADPGLNLAMDKDVKFDAEEASQLESEVEDYIHGLTRVVRTRGVDMNLLEAQVSNFAGNATSLISLMSATTRIPQRILTGSERGELGSTQDKHNWNERVGERQTAYADPIVRDLIERLGTRGMWDTPDAYAVIWPKPTPDESETAELVQTLASANQAQFQSEGVIIVTSDEMRQKTLKLPPLSDVLDFDDMPRPPGEEGDAPAPPASPDSTAPPGDEDEGVTQAASIVPAEQRSIRVDVQAAALKNEPGLIDILMDGFEEISAEVDQDALTEALANHDTPTATAILASAWSVAFPDTEGPEELA